MGTTGDGDAAAVTYVLEQVVNGEKPVKRAAVMLLVVICGSFMGCSHVAVYRTAGPAEPIAKRVCFEVGDGGNTELEQGLMSCVILHGLRFRVGYSGNTLPLTPGLMLTSRLIPDSLGSVRRC